MEILLGLCDGLLMGFALGNKLENQESLLYGDCVGYLLDFFMGVLVGISVGKSDGDKLGC